MNSPRQSVTITFIVVVLARYIEFSLQQENDNEDKTMVRLTMPSRGWPTVCPFYILKIIIFFSFSEQQT